jgi:hypothetical protein
MGREVKSFQVYHEGADAASRTHHTPVQVHQIGLINHYART